MTLSPSPPVQVQSSNQFNRQSTTSRGHSHYSATSLVSCHSLSARTYFPFHLFLLSVCFSPTRHRSIFEHIGKSELLSGLLILPSSVCATSAFTFINPSHLLQHSGETATGHFFNWNSFAHNWTVALVAQPVVTCTAAADVFTAETRSRPFPLRVPCSTN